MVTGYEVGFYRDIERIRRALETLVDVEKAKYLAFRLNYVDNSPETREELERYHNGLFPKAPQ